MKLACSSADLARSLETGTLTQLEWLDWCAAEAAVDGVAFDVRHFPRTDDEYLAQLKKLCADLGLTVAAVAGDGLFTEDPERTLSLALALGAPVALARAPLAATGDAEAWNRFVASAKLAARAAKSSNVTLGLRNAPGTLCPSAADCKRLQKDVDSAWIRFAPDIAALEAGEQAGALLPRAVVAAHTLGPNDDYGALAAALAGLRAFLIVEPAGGDPQAGVAAAVARLRRAAAERSLERSVAAP
jgi:sugar phosphate isomerase/epimerase